MTLIQLRHSSVWIAMLFSSTFFATVTTAHTNNKLRGKSSSEQLENTLVLNQGHDQHVTARSLKKSNGNKTFQSILNVPGVNITEQIHQQIDGRSIQENKIVVNIAKNQSVEFIQQFNGEGNRVSRSVIKRPISMAELHAPSDHKSMVASEGGKNDLAIEHQTTTSANNKYTTTTVRSNNFSLIPGGKKWMLIVSGGYALFSDAVQSDGSTGVGRLALNRAVLQTSGFDFGLEAGIQNGVNMRPIVQEPYLDAMGGVPILAIIKPVIELLPTISRQFSDNSSVRGFAKLGIAYRSMTFGNGIISNISKISPDLHLGLTANISDTITLMIFYQAIFGGNPDIKSTLFPLPANNIGSVENIPTQQGIFLGAAYSF